MRLQNLPHQQYGGRNCGCGPQFKTFSGAKELNKIFRRIRGFLPNRGGARGGPAG
ncbi:hypothetical protein A2U01_0109147, partial [Trifolium medium]|nr:hypothetical protein [Trifolium medium]